MNFCSHCGAPTTLAIPQGDNRQRHVCTNSDCGMIHYQNPKIITGCLPIYQDKVLLCKRAIEPRYGLWTLPAGFMENGETVEQGAIRESREEANANLEIEQLYTLFDLPHINQVHCLYRATLSDTNFAPGEESLAVALFDEASIPWDQLAFRVVAHTLRHYFADRKNNKHFPFRSVTLEPLN